ncbi:MAG: hypothetical protein IIA59_00565 [Candidatus Marinimicrobia bacterium]|nr:hypothetical protein [Candidatus Neomarinimicrobiota bacterium]
MSGVGPYKFILEAEEDKAALVNDTYLKNIKIRYMYRGMTVAKPSLTYDEKVAVLADEFLLGIKAIEKAIRKRPKSLESTPT